MSIFSCQQILFYSFITNAGVGDHLNLNAAHALLCDDVGRFLTTQQGQRGCVHSLPADPRRICVPVLTFKTGWEKGFLSKVLDYIFWSALDDSHKAPPISAPLTWESFRRRLPWECGTKTGRLPPAGPGRGEQGSFSPRPAPSEPCFLCWQSCRRCREPSPTLRKSAVVLSCRCFHFPRCL